MAAEGTFHFLFSLLLFVLRCFCVLVFLLGSLRAFGIGRFLMLEYQKSSAANTKPPQSASCFASLACFTRTSCASKVAAQRANQFEPQTARVMGTAGDDFWYSMKNPPYPSPVPSPARALHDHNPSRMQLTKTKPPTQRTGVRRGYL